MEEIPIYLDSRGVGAFVDGKNFPYPTNKGLTQRGYVVEYDFIEHKNPMEKPCIYPDNDGIPAYTDFKQYFIPPVKVLTSQGTYVEYDPTKPVELPKKKPEPIPELPVEKDEDEPVVETTNDPNIRRVIVNNLLDIISPKRYSNLENLIIIGKILYNTYFPDEKTGYAIWLQVAAKKCSDIQKPTPIPEKSFLSYWDKFRSKNPFTIRTFAAMAEKDNSEKYNKWHAGFINSFVGKAITGGHFHIASVVYWKHFTKFIYSGSTNGWYEFSGNYWEKGERQSNPFLSRYISQMLPLFFTSYKKTCQKELDKFEEELKFATDLADKAKIETNIKPIRAKLNKITSIMASLADNRYKQSVMKDCQDLFYDPSILKYQNLFPNITAYQNISVVATNREYIFRESYPDEFVTRYVPIFIPTNLITMDRNEFYALPQTKELVLWFAKVYARTKIVKTCYISSPDVCHTIKEVYDETTTTEVIHYILTLWSTAYQGVFHKIFIVMTGEGNNSKSMLMMIQKMIFGPMCQDLDFGSLEGTKNASGASPGLAKLDGAKVIRLVEPNEGKGLVDGMIKILTGGDIFYARGTYSNGGDITPICLLFLICNAIPAIPGNVAMKNRVQIIPHESTWVKNAPKDIEEQYNQRRFQEDPLFQRRLEELAPYLVILLVEEYNSQIGEKLEIPQYIKDATANFWSENDFYNLFNKEVVQRCIIAGSDTKDNPKGLLDPQVKITKSEMFKRFTDWYRNTFPSSNLPSRSTVLSELQRRIPEGVTPDGWFGYVLLDEKNSSFSLLPRK